MPKMKWTGTAAEVTGDTLDSADRSQFKPYDGPVPPNGLYCWKIKIMKITKASTGTQQLMVGIELTPRRSRPDEKPYGGYFLTQYLPITEGSAWRLAPFLDAIGVTGRDFVDRMIVGAKDNRGGLPVEKIGKFIQNGKALVMGQLADDTDNKGNARKQINGWWATPDKAAAAPVEEPADDDLPDDDADTDAGDDDTDDDAPF